MPNTWMLGIFFVGVLPSGAGITRPRPARAGEGASGTGSPWLDRVSRRDGHEQQRGSFVAGGAAYHGHQEVRVTIWFTVQLDDRPGALAEVAKALGDRGVNITGIVGVAEDTDGALMLTTSDAALTREAFDALGLPFEEHGEGVDMNG